ncbi:MAG: hypothetical protein Q8L29_01550 [archaeon]|nr:hypothetical protein [archaeon]
MTSYGTKDGREVGMLPRLWNSERIVKSYEEDKNFIRTLYRTTLILAGIGAITLGAILYNNNIERKTEVREVKASVLEKIEK